MKHDLLARTKWTRLLDDFSQGWQIIAGNSHQVLRRLVAHGAVAVGQLIEPGADLRFGRPGRRLGAEHACDDAEAGDAYRSAISTSFCAERCIHTIFR